MLEDLTCSIVEQSAKLSAKLREPLRVQVSEPTRWMHCYYSNLIEGQQTRVPKLLDHFQWRYESDDLSRIQRIIAIGASHHRLAWIHPFRDGNGRVVRLFSDALIRQLGIDGGGLFAIPRLRAESDGVLSTVVQCGPEA